MRMLAKSPEDRFPTIADAAAEAGLPLLAENDPLRAELIRLAAAEDSATLDLLHPTPVSPVPPSRASISEPRPQDSPPAAAEPVQAAAEPVPAAADPAPPAAVAERAGGGSRMTVVWWASFAAVALVAGVLAITKPWVAVRSGDQNHEEAKSDTSVGPKPEPPKPERPLGVRIANAPATVTVGDTFTLAAVVSGGDSTTRPPNEWQSRTTAVLAIDPAGRARAIRQGTAMVLLRLGPAEDSVPIRVLPAEPPHTASRLVINAPAGPVRVADHVPLRVVSVDSAGVRRPPTTRVTWSSANQAIASVDAATGDVTAKSAGRVRISASSVDGRASIDIVVAPAPEPPQPPPPPPPERPRRDSVIVQPKASPDSARERVPPTKSPAVLKAELDDAVRAYAHAIEAKDMDQLRSLYTGMTQLQADGYSGFFNYARDIKVSIDRIDAAGALSATPGSEARVRVDYRFEFFNTSRRKPDHLSAQWDATMQRTASGWRILQIR